LSSVDEFPDLWKCDRSYASIHADLITSIHIHLSPRYFSFPLTHLLHNEQKIHAVNPEEPYRDVWNYRNNLASQTVQELLQFRLIGVHAKIKAMDSVFR
jgi:hypothetical protein